jgi:hypothetical protein
MTDDLNKRLRAAADAVADADISTDLRAAAFMAAFWGAGVGQPAPPAAPEPAASSSGNNAEQIAGKLGIGPADVQLIYDLSGEEVGLLVPPNALPTSSRAAMREVIQLVAAGRQAVGLDDWTASELPRAVCAERGVLDTNNYAAVFRDIAGRGFSIRGSGGSREVRLNAAGFQTAGAVAQRLTTELA